MSLLYVRYLHQRIKHSLFSLYRQPSLYTYGSAAIRDAVFNPNSRNSLRGSFLSIEIYGIMDSSIYANLYNNSTMQDKLIVRGARNHNLKNISVELPKNKLVVFTGVSGSGKSTLAFDTIYAEGQRRYVESLSAYARQFLGIMAKPDVDSIEGLSPAISIDQKSRSHNPRSTVGTVTEIYDYLRLLFARIGHPHCASCGSEIAPMDKDQIITQAVSSIQQTIHGSKPAWFLVLAPLVRDRKGEFSALLSNIRSKGFTHARIDGRVFSLDEDILLIKTNRHSIEAVIDRITVTKPLLKDEVSLANLRSRLRESVEQALDIADGLVILSNVQDKSFSFPEKPLNMADHLFSERLACPNCNIAVPEIEPRLFSFNSPHGACESCKGLGTILKVNPSLVLNDRLSIKEGGILPFANQVENDTWYGRLLLTVAGEHRIDSTVPMAELTQEQKNILLSGTGSREYTVEGTNRFGRMTSITERFPGIMAELERRYGETSSEFVRYEIEKYMHTEVCKTCNGGRLKKEATTVTIQGKSILAINSQPVDEAATFIRSLAADDHLTNREQIIARPILKEVTKRLEFLRAVGLNYLTLGRDATTLAGGEAQRIRLASQIGSGLSGVLYVLDEPSIGLHPRDNQKLITTLKALRDLGNTVLVVEHDQEMIESADHVVDFGPGGGKQGGTIVAQGTVEEIKKHEKSLTGQYLSGKKEIRSASRRTKSETNYASSANPAVGGRNGELRMTNCSQFNLKNIDVDIPLGKFVCITGVSGSGKSTLIVETLYHALKKYKNPYYREEPGKYGVLHGAERLNNVYLIDQSPIGRTPRSNPATYVGAFSPIRSLFASTKESKQRGYTMGRFSFNVKGGRCENCEGQGEEKIEMQFLPAVWVPCDICGGKRYNQETLEVVFKGKSIADVLAMTIAEASDFFQNIPGLSVRLQTLFDTGLGYLQLGQPAPTLSGGEAQRVKLATELSKRSSTDNLYILDEPTTGLHFADLEKLLNVLGALVAQGNTVLVIEHNLEMVKNADYIIDLGPEGGDDGGYVVATGTPEEIMQNKKSYTGKFLATISNS